MRPSIVLLATLLSSLSSVAVAQQSGEAVIFERGDFKGASITLSSPTEHIDPAFTARSVRITGSAAWELCSGNTFTGCRRVDRSRAGVFIVRSARPVAPVVVTRVSPPNHSLRGVASEFFVAPSRGSARVAVARGSAEQMQREADDFCRAVGWQVSVHAQVQQEGTQFYLVDVLCTNKP